jgi:hypothetical protein
MKMLSIYAVLLFPFGTFSQVSSTPIIIEASTNAAGITKIVTADINNDSFTDIIISQGFGISNISYYTNNNGSFSTRNVIDSEALFAECIAAGDFNNDGWKDIAAITRQDGQIKWYRNTNGSFSAPILIDTDMVFLNYLVVADFDENNSDDIVVIGQHSIDFYRNNGSGIFNKEAILTTSTSPNILECMHLSKADMNGDGHIDLVVGETLGPVIYFNSGTGIFTPHIVSVPMITTSFLFPFDVNGDGTKDIVSQNASDQLRWFSNNGSGTMASEGDLFVLPDLQSIEAIDFNSDGKLDLFTGYNDKAVVFTNNGNGTFNPETILYQNSGLTFLREVAIADLNNDTAPDYIWASINGTLAYQLNTSSLNSTHFVQDNYLIYPNPVSDHLIIEMMKGKIGTVKIYNAMGQIIYDGDLTTSKKIDASHLQSGIYTLSLRSEGKTSNEKIIKN